MLVVQAGEVAIVVEVVVGIVEYDDGGSVCGGYDAAARELWF